MCFLYRPVFHIMGKKAMKVGILVFFTIYTLDKRHFLIYNKHTMLPTENSIKARDKNTKEAGFTVIELLVVIAIIGILSSVVLSSLNSAREKGNTAKVEADLRNVRSAIALLADDTGKWPNGCPIAVGANPEIDLNTASAGLALQPSVEDNTGGCAWVASEVAAWSGPYIENLTDPWGNSYYFDPDFRPYDNCASIPDEPQNVSVVSLGPNGASLNGYDCDDIYLQIQ